MLDGTTRNRPKPRRISWRYLGHSTLAPSGQSKYLVTFPRFGCWAGVREAVPPASAGIRAVLFHTTVVPPQKNQITGWLFYAFFFQLKHGLQELLEEWNIHLENHWFYPKNRWVFLKRKKPGSSGYYILILFSKPRTGSSLIAKCSCKREEEAAASRCLQNQSFQNPELTVLWYRKMFLRTNEISKIKTRISKIKFDSDFSSKPRTGSSLSFGNGLQKRNQWVLAKSNLIPNFL